MTTMFVKGWVWRSICSNDDVEHIEYIKDNRLFGSVCLTVLNAHLSHNGIISGYFIIEYSMRCYETPVAEHGHTLRICN